MKTRTAVVWVAIAGGCGGDDASDEGADGSEGSASVDESGGGGELDDPFDGDLSGWDVLNPERADVRVEGGELVIEPTAMSLWFQASAAVLVSKRVEGDFVVTSHVRARSLSDPTAPPAPPFRLGGLMARDPDGAGEDYVFIVIGADLNDVSVETKTTDDSVSTYEGPPWPSAEGDLRICRQGSRFVLSIRETSTSAWEQKAAFDRPDLPATLQVGPLAYANADPADLRVTFDAVDFEPLTGGCPM